MKDAKNYLTVFFTLKASILDTHGTWSSLKERYLPVHQHSSLPSKAGPEFLLEVAL